MRCQCINRKWEELNPRKNAVNVKLNNNQRGGGRKPTQREEGLGRG